MADKLTKRQICGIVDHIFVAYETDEARCARCGMVFMSEAIVGDLRERVTAWKKAIEGLTPSGSEYVDDPERCAAYIRERLAGPKTVRDLRARVKVLEEVLIDQIIIAGTHVAHDNCHAKLGACIDLALAALKEKP